MATKKKTSTDPGKLATKAIALAVTALRSPEVQEQLRKAPAAVADWASDHKARGADGGARASLERFNPADRFGQRGLERRIKKLDEAFTLSFGDRETTSEPELWVALDELQKAIAVAAGLPALKRKKMQLRIDDELDELEAGLMDAVMPKT